MSRNIATKVTEMMADWAKKDADAHTTLIGSVAKGIPGTDILETDKVQITKDSTEDAVHN